MADDPGGIAAHDDILGDVFGHDGAGGNDAVFADRHAGAYRGIGADPDVLPDGYLVVGEEPVAAVESLSSMRTPWTGN